MPLGLLGTLDLSVVTDRLLDLLRDFYNKWPLFDDHGGPLQRFNIVISGAMPESIRANGGCQLCLYLLHVREDANQKNSPVMGRALPIPFQPLSLDLYYLLTAFSADDYRQEQRAMSIALRCFHENPIVSMSVPIEGTAVREEVTLQMQVESPAELSTVWQSFNTPFRLSTVYRAGVVFVTPEAETSQPARKPDRVVVAAAPATLPLAEPGQVFGTISTVRVHAPSSTVAHEEFREFELSPAVVAAGDTFLLAGAGLDRPETHRVYLLPPSGPEQDVSAWIDHANSTPARRALQVPAGGAAPRAGVYQLWVGSNVAAGDPGTYRSNATPFSIAAKVGPATNPPLLTPVAGVYTVTGAGFVDGATDVLLGTVALAATGDATPGPGRFRVVDATTVTFRPPTALAPGRYDVRIRTDGVESTPAWWVVVP